MTEEAVEETSVDVVSENNSEAKAEDDSNKETKEEN